MIATVHSKYSTLTQQFLKLNIHCISSKQYLVSWMKTRFVENERWENWYNRTQETLNKSDYILYCLLTKMSSLAKKAFGE